MPRKGSRKHRRSHRRNKMMGGTSAAEYVASVVGGAGQQAAEAGHGNLITPSHPVHPGQTGGSHLASSVYSHDMKGGERRDNKESPPQMGGRTIIADVGVPAALIYTRQLLNRRRGKSSRRHSRRRSNRKL